MPGIDPKILLLIITLGMGFQGYEHVVKPAVVKIAHVTEQGLKQAGRGLQWIVGHRGHRDRSQQVPPQPVEICETLECSTTVK